MNNSNRGEKRPVGSNIHSPSNNEKKIRRKLPTNLSTDTIRTVQARQDPWTTPRAVPVTGPMAGPMAAQVNAKSTELGWPLLPSGLPLAAPLRPRHNPNDPENLDHIVVSASSHGPQENENPSSLTNTSIPKPQPSDATPSIAPGGNMPPQAKSVIQSTEQPSKQLPQLAPNDPSNWFNQPPRPPVQPPHPPVQPQQSHNPNNLPPPVRRIDIRPELPISQPRGNGMNEIVTFGQKQVRPSGGSMRWTATIGMGLLALWGGNTLVRARADLQASNIIKEIAPKDYPWDTVTLHGSPSYQVSVRGINRACLESEMELSPQQRSRILIIETPATPKTASTAAQALSITRLSLSNITGLTSGQAKISQEHLNNWDRYDRSRLCPQKLYGLAPGSKSADGSIALPSNTQAQDKP